MRIVGKEIPISDVFGALIWKAKRVEFRINKLIRQSSFDQGLRPYFEIQYIFWAKRFICGFSKNDFFRHFWNWNALFPPPKWASNYSHDSGRNDAFHGRILGKNGKFGLKQYVSLLVEMTHSMVEFSEKTGNSGWTNTFLYCRRENSWFKKFP